METTLDVDVLGVIGEGDEGKRLAEFIPVGLDEVLRDRPEHRPRDRVHALRRVEREVLHFRGSIDADHHFSLPG